MWGSCPTIVDLPAPAVMRVIQRNVGFLSLNIYYPEFCRPRYSYPRTMTRREGSGRTCSKARLHNSSGAAAKDRIRINSFSSTAGENAPDSSHENRVGFVREDLEQVLRLALPGEFVLARLAGCSPPRFSISRQVEG